MVLCDTELTPAVVGILSYYKFGSFYKKIGTRLSFKVRTSVGLRCSWPLMAISHHNLVRKRFVQAGRSSFCTSSFPYRIMEDDVIIADEKTAHA